MSIKSKCKNSPNFIKYTLQFLYKFIPQSFIKGKEYTIIYNDIYNNLKKTEKYTNEQMENLTQTKLKNLLQDIYLNVDFYKELFDKHNINVYSDDILKEYKRIPFSTKALIRDNYVKLCSKKYDKKKLKTEKTGGTTGVPLEFYIDPMEWAVENAFVQNMYDRIGYKNGMRTVVLRGNKVNINEKKDIFWERKIHFNELIMSSFSLNKATVHIYLNKIKQFKPVCIKAYPSSLNILAEYINEKNIQSDFKFIKGIILASESIYDFQREGFKNAFKNAKVFSFYGHTEHGCIAGECEYNTAYHIQSEYGYVELIDDDGNEVLEDGKIGEIVCTSFINNVTPFIRYRTGDMAVYSSEVCKCGRAYKLLKKIEGRKQDFFIDINGDKINYIQHDAAVTTIKDKIKAYQYEQNEPGKLLLKIEPKSKLSDSDILEVKNNFNIYYSKFELEIREVENIERTSRGKFLYFIQNIK
ncbi:phenylacetate-CoA ligase [Clostridium cavendishii DSM 21758]|uniref:Phenylacetate-CoA ligase n=1 Tax=Clostridium cavendishii DSM 21758 TaxID=1121302 RepID=A0A1M6Q8Y3_9CLOT|nr:phenylacetate--CoA ligase family protein [Clostridium cavendishii]SHK16616.1 phenylacetate-CoA ligase [Clostridium cavendishii DSM 21758]